MKVYFGCGKHKIHGYFGVDKVPMDSVDVVHDMNVYPYPFRDNSVDEVLLINILEHLPDTIKVMEEIWRICRNGASVKIVVPYYNSLGACNDPTHVRFFTEYTFDYFTHDNATYLSSYNYYSIARFKIISITPDQRPLLKMFPMKIQWLLAHHLSTVHSLEIKLGAVK